MNTVQNKELINKLIPALTFQEKQNMIAYYTLFEKHEKEISEEALADLMDHPVFGKLIRDTPKEVSEANNKISKEFQKGALYNDKWEELVKYQMQQGITYAKMGLNFGSWYEIVVLFKKYMLPYILSDLSDSEEMLNVMSGMNLYMDISMCIIGEAYIQAKEEIITEEKQKIEELNNTLEQKVEERTAELVSTNKELDSFTYTVSHDLRAPLRAINGYAAILTEDYNDKLDDEGRRIIETISHNSNKMGQLIDDLLAFSKLGKKELSTSVINMNEMIEGAIIELNKSVKHKVQFKYENLHSVNADYGLLYQAVFNLISNGVKYSSTKEKPVIEISSEEKKDGIIFTFKDNGVGFNMNYVNKLFGVFQRLHSQEEFEGTGVGLAIVQRVISKHNGRVWAKGEVGKGAEFSFSLPKHKL